MTRLVRRIWQWLCVIFSGQKSLRQIAADAQNMIKDALSKPKAKNEKHRGTLIWDSRAGTYRRRAPKIGRNAPCPCGAMRTAPRDETKPTKYKWHCGANK